MRRRLAITVAMVASGLAIPSSHATVPAPVIPFPMAPPATVALHDNVGDVGEGDLDIRTVRVYRTSPYCGGPCPESADGAVGAVFTLAKPVRNNAIYSLFLTSGGKRFQLAAKRAAGVDSFFVFRFSDASKTDRFVYGSFRGRVIQVFAALRTVGFGFKPFRFSAAAGATNGRRGGVDKAPDGSKTVRFTR
jgi:hypothetical protein